MDLNQLSNIPMKYPPTRLVSAALLVSSLFVCHHAQAAFDTFMTFTGGTAPVTQGESTTVGFENAVEVFSFSWGVSNPVTLRKGTGLSPERPTFSSFNILKRADSASPALLAACAAGNYYDEVKVTLRRPGGDGSSFVFQVYTFKHVFVSSLQWSGSSGGDDTPTESVSLVYEQVVYEYTKAPNAQEPDPDPIVLGWDVVKNDFLP